MNQTPMNQPKKHARNKIDWENIKVTFVLADRNKPNPLHPYSHLSDDERQRQSIDLAAKIWARALMGEKY